MLFTASLLALSLAGTSTPASCIVPTQTGVFRITATTKDSSDASVGLLILESVDNCLEATIVAGESGPAIIEDVALSEDVLTGHVHMRTGIGDVKLRLSSQDITGSIISGKRMWHVSGRRTSGGEARAAAGDVAPPKKP
jgi:hypothetical protein